MSGLCGAAVFISSFVRRPLRRARALVPVLVVPAVEPPSGGLSLPLQFAPDFAPWLPDLPRARVPELVIRIPVEGVPRAQFEDGEGGRVECDRRLRDWLLAARAAGTLFVNAGSVAEAFALLDVERLEGRPPGRLFNGEADR